MKPAMPVIKYVAIRQHDIAKRPVFGAAGKKTKVIDGDCLSRKLPDHNLQYAYAGRPRGKARRHHLVHRKEASLIAAKSISCGQAIVDKRDQRDAYKHATINHRREFNDAHRAGHKRSIVNGPADSKHTVAAE
jgi:hypothetical protein